MPTIASRGDPFGPIDTIRDPRMGQGLRAVQRGRLVIVAGSHGGEVMVGARRVTVGRAAGNDLVLADPTVSAIHFEVVSAEEGYLLRDLGSTNGTFLGPSRVKEALLGAGAELQVGGFVLRFVPLEEIEAVELSSADHFGAVLGRTEPMRQLFSILERVAPTDLTVLLEGETGTGKEELARAIALRSPRADGPFVVVDCGAIASGLAEAVLFGHEKGAFTGADRRRLGAFEAAHGGTVFLDEIGELPPALQPKLLRALESRTVTRLGDHQVRAFDARLVAATNRDLRGMVNRGQFRSDLYYRLAEVWVEVPPLRARKDDIRLLARHLLERIAARFGRAFELSEDALTRMERYDWPGNVRELRSLLERAVALADGDSITDAMIGASVDPASVPAALPIDPSLPYKEAQEKVLQHFDAIYLAELLERYDGNLTHAAKAADLARHNFRRRLKKAGIRHSGGDD